MKTYKLNIDFNELRNQKEELVKLLFENEFNGSDLPSPLLPALQGVIHLMDEIQDQAVDIHGISEATVFGFEREVDIDEDMSGEWVKIKKI